MATKVLADEPALLNIRQFGVFDDFIDFVDGTVWLKTSADTGAAVAIDADGVGGIVTLSAGTADNGEAYLETNELFKFAADKPLQAIARIKLTTVSANAAAFAFGLIDAPGADTIQDDEAGPAATYHGAMFFKNSGAATLAVEATAASSVAQTVTTTDISVGTGYESYMIHVEAVSATDKRVTYYHDPDGGYNWKQCKDTNGLLIKHIITLSDPAAGTGEMGLFFGIKNSSAGEAQTLDVDYGGCWQIR